MARGRAQFSPTRVNGVSFKHFREDQTIRDSMG